MGIQSDGIEVSKLKFEAGLHGPDQDSKIMRIRGQTRGRPKYFQRFSNGFRRVPHIIRSSRIASADIQRSQDPWVL